MSRSPAAVVSVAGATQPIANKGPVAGPGPSGHREAQSLVLNTAETLGSPRMVMASGGRVAGRAYRSSSGRPVPSPIDGTATRIVGGLSFEPTAFSPDGRHIAF
jgi:hypothetical protein